jgi:BA14K-like protein
MTNRFKSSFTGMRRRVVTGMLSGLIVVAGATAAAAQNSRQCDAYARDIANRYTNTAGNVVGGAALGAIGGAIIGGAIRGGKGAGRGAVIGGGVGALGGAAHNSQEWQNRYYAAYNDCMQSAGVRTYRAVARPQPWSDEWYAYCSAKYRSFDPGSGTYQPNNGPRRLCR